jgi:hypothetical protein
MLGYFETALSDLVESLDVSSEERERKLEVAHVGGYCMVNIVR